MDYVQRIGAEVMTTCNEKSSMENMEKLAMYAIHVPHFTKKKHRESVYQLYTV